MSSTQVNNQTVQISTPIYVPYDAITGTLINGFQTKINFALLKQLWRESTTFTPAFPYLIKTNEANCEHCFQAISQPHFCACTKMAPIQFEHVAIANHDEFINADKMNTEQQLIEQIQLSFWREWVQTNIRNDTLTIVDRGASYHKDYTISQLTSTFNADNTQYCLPTIMDICYQRVLASMVSTFTPNALPYCFESIEEPKQPGKPKKPEPKEEEEPKECVCFSPWQWNVCKVNNGRRNNNCNNNNRIINSIIDTIITTITTTTITLTTTYYLSTYLQYYYYLYLVQQQVLHLQQQQQQEQCLLSLLSLLSPLLLSLQSNQSPSSSSSSSCTSSCSCQSCFDLGCSSSSLSDRGLGDRGLGDRGLFDDCCFDFSESAMDMGMGMRGFRGAFRGTFRDFHFHHHSAIHAQAAWPCAAVASATVA